MRASQSAALALDVLEQSWHVCHIVADQLQILAGEV